MHSYKGLSTAQAEENRAKFGTNDLTPPPRESWVKLLLSKFNDSIIRLLLVATVLSLITGYFHGSMVESFGIMIAVVLATFLSFFNEYKAGKEFDILNRINDCTPVKVYRDGTVHRIPKNELTVGDVVILERGDEIPADGRLLTSLDLSVNESSLNGESVASSKTHVQTDDFKGAYSPNHVYRGTVVMEGEGIFEVTAVGDKTEIGKTARQASELTGAETPLNKQLKKLSDAIGKAGFIIAGITFIALVLRDLILGVLTFSPTLDNFSILLSFFMIAVTLIVVAVPEGLAMSVTLSLAYSMRRMTAGHTLVRKMHACETMGAATVICTDKTGTLTQNRMQVQYSSRNPDLCLAREAALNSTAMLEKTENGYATVGNQTEGAILSYLKEKGFDYESIRENGRILQRMLFNTERKYMATLVASEETEKRVLYVKGAPEIIIAKCNRLADSDMDKDGADFDPQKMSDRVREYQARGMRCLAFARAEIGGDAARRPISELAENIPLAYSGFVAIADPIREDVPYSMRQCLNAGIKVKIVTGDTALTAVEIARQAGLWTDEDTREQSITGAEFEALPDSAAKEAARRIKIMARARPEDKMRLVRLLQEDGEVVAVTGDGTNDAPALNYADVGLAMGSGTAVAKEASDIILLNDSFTSVTSAVKWGRSIYLNIQKFIQFQLTINVVALLTALAGPFIGIEFPLTVTQMLWVNLIMDTFAALALATEPAYDFVMEKKPRGVNDYIVTPAMQRNIIVAGAVFLVFLFALLLYFNRNGNISTYELSFFFTFFVMLQFWNMFNSRTLGGNQSAFYKIGKNKSFLFIAAIILTLQFVIVEFGGDFFRTAPLKATDWILIIAGTSPVLWIGELIRYRKRKSRKR